MSEVTARSINNVRNEIYRIVNNFCSPLEGKGFEGNGHHFAQQMSKLVVNEMKKRLSMETLREEEK